MYNSLFEEFIMTAEFKAGPGCQYIDLCIKGCAQAETLCQEIGYRRECLIDPDAFNKKYGGIRDALNYQAEVTTCQNPEAIAALQEAKRLLSLSTS